MKTSTLSFFLAFFCFISVAHSQKLRLQSGEYPVPSDFEERLAEDRFPEDAFQGKLHGILSFDATPDAEQRAEMEALGIRFLRYLPENSYIVGYDEGSDLSELKKHEVRSLFPMEEEHKMGPELLDRAFPDHAVKGDALELELKFFQDLSFTEVLSELKEQSGVELLRTLENSHRAEVRIPKDGLEELAAEPYIMVVDPIDPEPTPDDRTGRTLHRSNSINSQVPGGLRYNGRAHGDSVVMAIADDGGIGPHIDLKGRVTDHTGGPGGGHGDMTAGIAMGAGNLDPTIQGMATGAHLHMYDISGYPHINDAVTNLQNLETRITSTSYSQGCNDYDGDAQTADDQIQQNPELIHVFSAGNSASSDCGYGASGWGNITGGTKQGKNVIATGNLDYEDVLASSSSRGPAEDGRVKPELCANGAGQLSLEEDNNYDPGGGTSAAAPGVAGVVAQLYDAFKDLNGNYPKSALIQAALLNTAEDLDDPGPDFNTGYGRIHAGRAYGLLEDGRYLEDSVDQGDVNNHSISVPSGVDQLRVLIHWSDPGGSTMASKALVNDLNMELTTPGGTDYDPWVLDHTPNSTALDAPATRNRDSINNIEQVTLETPASGSYDISVEGFQVPQGPQNYFLVYEFIEEGVELSYPKGGEGFVPGTDETIRWDAHGNSTDFDLEYSTDSGSTWNSIASNLSGDLRHYDWTPPSTVSGEAFIRVTRGSDSDTNETPFAIIETPDNIDFEWVCPDSARITWDSVPGAVGYEVYQLGTYYMDSIAFTTDTFHTLQPFSPASEQWFSVSAHAPGNTEGRRAIAVRYDGGSTFNCPLDTNLRLTLSTPSSASFPDCHAGDIPVKVEVKNVGKDSVLGFDASYALNGGTPNALVYSDTLAPDSVVELTFTDSVNLPNTGYHDLIAWVDHSGDLDPYDDTSTTVTLQKQSGTSYSLPYMQDMEGMTYCAGDHDDCPHECPLQEDLINQPHPEVDDIDWRVIDGETPSDNTGPTTDYDPGTAQGQYLYLEPSYGCEDREGELVTPCIDIDGAVPQLEYAYHMYGSDMGDLHVDILVDGVWHKNVTTPISGDQGDAWFVDTVDLSAYQGKWMSIRFRGVTGDGLESDIAIDAIKLIDQEAPPIPDFSGAPRNACQNEVVKLQEETTGIVDSVEWSIQPSTFNFVNGTDAKSMDPEVEFTANGTYEVQLKASNAYGSDSILKTSYIVVGPSSSAPVSEDFENSNFPPDRWNVQDGGGSDTWKEADNIAGEDGLPTKAAFVENYYYDNQGFEDELVMEIVDLSGAPDPFLTFDVAYARYSDNYYEGLRVKVEDTCGPVSMEYSKYSDDLSTVPDETDPWAPSSSNDWRKDTVDLSSYAGSEEVRIRFANVNGYGNNLYIDNINIHDEPSSIEDRKKEASTWKLYPNPADDRLMIDAKVGEAGERELRIEDMRGRTVKRTVRTLQKGENQLELDLDGLENGIYLLKASGDGSDRILEKFVIQHGAR